MSGNENQQPSASAQDQRVVRTRQAVVDALTELARGRSVREITVKELVDNANVGRSTFYEHFENIEDLLCWLVDELVEEVRDPDGRFRLDALLGFVGGMPEVSRAFLEIESCAVKCQVALTDCLPGSNRSARRFAAAGVMALLAEWLDDAHRRPLDDLVDDTCGLVDSLLATAPSAADEIRVVATLGPAGSNHDVVLRQRLAAVSGSAAVNRTTSNPTTSNQPTISLHPTVEDALAACVDGRADHLLICAAHPDCGSVVGTAQYRHDLVIIETFVADSQPLAILKRPDTDDLTTIALHPATRCYTDLSAWKRVVEVPSTVAAAQGLRQGKWGFALTAERHADDGEAEIVRSLAPPRDAWLLLGPRPVTAEYI